MLERAPQGPLIDVVAEFGAAGDSTGAPGSGSDDTAKIRAALAEGIAYLPGFRNGQPRYYRVTDRLTLGSSSGIVGAGVGRSIIVPDFAVAGNPNRVIDNDWVNGNADVTLVGFGIKRSAAGNVQHGILLNGIDGLVLDQVRVFGLPQANAGCIGISGVGPTTALLSQHLAIGTLDLRDTSNFGLQVGYVNGLVVDQILGDNAYRELFGIEPAAGATAENIVVGRVLGKGSAASAGTATGMVIVTNSGGGTIGSGIEFGELMLDNGAAAIAADTSPGLFVRGVTDGLAVGTVTVRRANGAGVLIGAAGVTTQGVVIGRVVALDCNKGGNASPNSVGLGFRGATQCGWDEAYIHGAAHTASVEETSSAGNNQHGRLRSLDTKRFNTVAVTSTINEDIAAVAAFPGAGGAVSPDIGAGNFLSITVTDATAFTINSPANHTQGRVFTYEILNTSGGAMGAITWGAQYKLAGAFVNPATGKRRTITFCDDGTNCVEIARAAADI